MAKKSLAMFLIFGMLLTACAAKKTAVTNNTSATSDKSYTSKFRSKKNHPAPSNVTYEIYDEIYTFSFNDSVQVHYPQIKGLSDKRRQDAVNDLIKTHIMENLDFLKWGDIVDRLSWDIDYDIRWQGNSLLSIQYFGMSFVAGSAHPNEILYHLNIDLTTGKQVDLNDLIHINGLFAENWKNHKKVTGLFRYDRMDIDPEKLEATEKKREIDANENPLKGRLDNECITKLFNNASRVYFSEDSLGVTAYNLHRAYLEYEIKYQDMAQFIKDKNNPVWKELLFSASAVRLKDTNKINPPSRLSSENRQKTGSPPENYPNGKYKLVKINDTVFSDKIRINYSQITGLGDKDKQNKLNNLLMQTALKTLYPYKVLDLYEKKVIAEIKHEITWQSENFLSVKYFGEGVFDGGKPDFLFYAANINLADAYKSELSDRVDMDKIAAKYEDQLRNLFVWEKDFYSQSSYKDLVRRFTHTDSRRAPVEYNYKCSYTTADSLVICVLNKDIPAGHTKLEIKYRDIAEAVKNKNTPIWQGLIR